MNKNCPVYEIDYRGPGNLSTLKCDQCFAENILENNNSFIHIYLPNI